MNDKKHIDRLFQEHFKDFEEAPDDAVWKNIEAKLNKKKEKRRIIPIWWRYAGAAALLLLFLAIGNIYFTTTNNNSLIVDTEDTTLEKANTKETNLSNKIKKTALPMDSEVAETSTSKNKKENKYKTGLTLNSNSLNTSNQSKNVVIADNNSIKQNLKKVKESEHEIQLNKSNLSSENLFNQKSTNNAVSNNSEKKNNTINLSNKEKNKTSIASNISENKNITKKEALLIDKEKAKKLIDNTVKNTIVSEAKKEITETIVKNKTKENSLTIEEVLDKNTTKEEKSSSNKWSIAPNAAPVYFNTLNGEGSSIDPQFNNNSKSGELNMSYGISASYAINSKLSIRSGINKVNLGYNTNNVVAFQSLGLNTDNSSLRNVNSRNNDSNAVALSLISAESLDSDNPIPEPFTSSNTSINQALGYIEIPLEIKYILSNKKLGVNVIGGFSSFFLNDNEIFSEAENGSRTFLGEANNINKVSYSANLGLGLNYQISKKIDLNLEPIFKYQINTFNNTSGNFKPYILGVYTGFSIKF
ncbi:hypothetical protein A8C32_19145 [Flavivirga aquatica]|uniref:Outer membrane protein beta-barrel domain-containing protein n=1 Tax=Flavivirga aquatica TaxID=1849968 RepID=A0A1E5T441_9FLAO|nr:hypothetical protein [Flavivirga aquatica]OEK06148.1 hypothetical protein A8C32_19145 [Flavivirga aquatica]